jgi:hypothetical protein
MQIQSEFNSKQYNFLEEKTHPLPLRRRGMIQETPSKYFLKQVLKIN